MFKFNFCEENCNKDEEDDRNLKSELQWFEASKVDIPLQYLQDNYINLEPLLHFTLEDFSLKIIDSTQVVIKLTEENCANIIEAESQHSDLLPSKYEGGLKIWESTYDLGNYLLKQDISLKNQRVLDLGCGAGIIGIIAFLRGSIVHFQDYNFEVIKSLTIPNVMLNCNNDQNFKDKCKFYCGDWKSFVDLLNKDNIDEKYDYIFTSETIYNPDNYQKLYNVFKQKLRHKGIGIIAGKSYYFGVGGGMREFEDFIVKDGEFDVKVVWKTDEGLQREILELKRKTF